MSVPRSLYSRIRLARSVCRVSYAFASSVLSEDLRREPRSPKPRRRSSLAAAMRSAGLMRNFLGVNGLSLPVIV